MKRYSSIETLLWIVGIGGSAVLFSGNDGCDLSSNPDPSQQTKAAVAINPNSSVTDPYTKAWNDVSSAAREGNEEAQSWVNLTSLLQRAYNGPPKGSQFQTAPRAPGGGSCPPINFAQASIEMALTFDTTGKVVLTGVLYRQPDGSFTMQGFSIPAGSSTAT